MTEPIDYRESHLGKDKAQSYSESFSEDPYKNMIWRHEQRFLDAIVKRCCPSGVIRHLDFACGTGRILEYLERFDAMVSVGVDISPSMLGVARQRTKRSEILEGDITREDILGNRKFDLITAFRFFPNAQVELREHAMSALASSLEPDGVLVFNNHKNLAFPANRLKRLLGRGFTRGMTLLEAERLVTAVGLRIEDVYHVGVMPVTNRYRLFPCKLLDILEHAMSRCKILRYIAMNQIYACRRTQ